MENNDYKTRQKIFDFIDTLNNMEEEKNKKIEDFKTCIKDSLQQKSFKIDKGQIWYRARKFSLSKKGIAERVFFEDVYFHNYFDMCYGKKFIFANVSKPTILYQYCATDSGELFIKNIESNFWGYNAKESGVPPKEMCKAQRANKQFEPVLYLIDDIATGLLEIGASYWEVISVAKFQAKEDLQVLDFFHDKIDDTMDYLNYYFSQINNSESVYEISQVLTDIAKELKFDGVMYKSVKNPEKTCLAIFESDKFECISSDLYRIDKPIEISLITAKNQE